MVGEVTLEDGLERFAKSFTGSVVPAQELILPRPEQIVELVSSKTLKKTVPPLLENIELKLSQLNPVKLIGVDCINPFVKVWGGVKAQLN